MGCREVSNTTGPSEEEDEEQKEQIANAPVT